MSPKCFLRTVAAAAMLATGLSAQAGTMTLNGPFHGAYNTVSVVTPNASYSGGLAGGFAVSLNGFSEFGGTFNGMAFESYCVDVYEYVGTSASYSILTAASYFNANPSKSTALGKLISYVYGSNVFGAATDKDQQSTALQLAIWNVVYDADNTLSGGAAFGGTMYEKTGSSFRNSTAAYKGTDDLLSLSQTYTGGPAYELFVLSSGRPLSSLAGNQDQLIWRQTVPEPASLALVALALGGAVVASRRRRG